MLRQMDTAPGALIRGHRQAAGMTQRRLAETADMSIGVVRDLEQGLTRRPRAATVRRLAAALNLDRRETERLLTAAPRGAAAGPAILGFAPGGPPGLRISVLGPVTAWRDGSFVPLGPPDQRAVLGLLALSPNTALHREALIDALWADTPPGAAVAKIQSYVSRLRRLLDPAWPPGPREPQKPAGAPGGGRQALITSGTSYRLCAAAGELDVTEFGQLTSGARDAHEVGDLALACRLYAQALALWRGEPLAGLPALSAHPAVVDLAHQQTDAVLGYADAAFAAGWHDRVLRPLQALHLREPLNERAAAGLMVALAGSGCQAAALGVYDEVRRRLDGQLGVHPCADLAATQTMVLRQQLTPGALSHHATRRPPGGPPRPRPRPAA